MPAHKKIEDTEASRVAEMLAEGITIRKISAYYEVAPTTVTTFIKRHGLKKRQDTYRPYTTAEIKKIERLMYVEGRSTVEVAEEVGRTPSALFALASRMGWKRRHNRHRIGDEYKTLPQWIKHYGSDVSPGLAWNRIHKSGWSVHRAVTTSPGPQGGGRRLPKIDKTSPQYMAQSMSWRPA